MTGGKQGGPPGRILLVEDDPVAAHFTKHVLGKRGGFDVTHTPDPAVALKRASSETWDLVLTDVELPGMTGLELLEALRRIAPDLPVAVITAHESVDTAVRALRNRADEFLQKPVRADQLLATVTSLVAKGRAARLAARQAVLAIGAHPGDVEIGVAGVLLAHRAMGHEVSILTLTRGACDGTERTRAGESQMSALVLGATLFAEDLPDGRVGDGEPTIGVISGIVESIRPTVIYVHSIHDVHQDHRHTHQAALEAARQVGRIYCFQSPSATVDFRPTRFVTIDDQLERKLLAVGAFASQAEVRDYVERDLIESTAGYWSRFGVGRYGEALEVIREAAMTAGQPAGPAAASTQPQL
jgi:two-component system response regulator HydG